MKAELVYKNGKFYAYISKTQMQIELDICDPIAGKMEDIFLGRTNKDEDKEKMLEEIAKLRAAICEAHQALSKAVSFAVVG